VTVSRRSDRSIPRGDRLEPWSRVAGLYSASPFAGWRFRRNVLGSSPSPQILNDLVPGTGWCLRLGLAPELELVEVLGGYLVIRDAIKEVLT
jgi:hypothetical protein